MDTTPPLFSYIYSDPLVHFDADHEEHDVESLDIENEMHMIKNAISSAKCPTRWAAKVASEQHFVSSYCTSTIFHFTGHGIDGSMAFESETGELKFINVSDLREMCKNLSKKPAVLFLSMCHGKKVGLAFADLGIDHVITVCNDRILDKASLLFADQFYRALLSGHSVCEAFEQGLARLQDSYPEEKAKYFLTGRSDKHSEIIFPNVESIFDACSLSLIDETPKLPLSTCNEMTSFFVGRRRDIFHIYKALVTKNRVVSVIGPRGIGKSQLALASGSYCRDRYLFDALLYWEIDGDSSLTESGYFQKLYQVFDITPGDLRCTIEKAADAIRDKWADQRVLCIIDGIPCAEMGDSNTGFVKSFINIILKRIKSISILTTSRDQLFCSHPVRVVTVGPLKDIFAAELFVYRSPGSLSRGELTQFETDHVSDNPLISFSKTAIVQSLCGNPLIIERAAMETSGRNLLLYRTEFIMKIIPRILADINGESETPPDKAPSLLRSVSERPLHSVGPFARTTSETQPNIFTRSTFSSAPSIGSQLKSGHDILSEVDIEFELENTYHSMVGSSRPLTAEDFFFLKGRLNFDDQRTVNRTEFQIFFTWYSKILSCFARSDLWLIPGCIHGFINRVKASELLRALPDSPQKKGVFIIGVSESEACLVVSFVTDALTVLPCKIYFDEDAIDAPFSVLTKNASGSTETISFDKLASVIIHLQQLSAFYPGEVDKFEKLGMLKC